MRSSERHQLPTGWRPMSGTLLLLAICAPVAVVAVLQAALPTLGTAAWAGGAAAVAGSVLVLIGSYAVVKSRWRRPGITSFEIDEKARATRIRYSREVIVLRILALTAAAATCAALGLWASPEGIGPLAVLLFILGLMFLGWLVLWVVRGVRRGELTLGPEGIALTVNSRDLSARWPDVIGLITWDAAQRGAVWRRIDISAREVRGWREPTRHEWLFDPRFSEPSIEIRCDLIDVDSLLLHSWLRFYVDNPGARTELGTPASLARARAADFSY